MSFLTFLCLKCKNNSFFISSFFPITRFEKIFNFDCFFRCHCVSILFPKTVILSCVFCYPVITYLNDVCRPHTSWGPHCKNHAPLSFVEHKSLTALTQEISQHLPWRHQLRRRRNTSTEIKMRNECLPGKDCHFEIHVICSMRSC